MSVNVAEAFRAAREALRADLEVAVNRYYDANPERLCQWARRYAEAFAQCAPVMGMNLTPVKDAEEKARVLDETAPRIVDGAKYRGSAVHDFADIRRRMEELSSDGK